MPLLYCMTEVRLITFRSLILANFEEQFVLDSVGEECVLFFFAQVFQRKNGNAFVWNRGGLRLG